jgi:hypothetical protein
VVKLRISNRWRCPETTICTPTGSVLSDDACKVGLSRKSTS